MIATGQSLKEVSEDWDMEDIRIANSFLDMKDDMSAAFQSYIDRKMKVDLANIKKGKK